MTTQNERENVIDGDFEAVLPANRGGNDTFEDIFDLLDGLNVGNEIAQIGLYRQTGSGREPMTFLDEFPHDRFDSMGLQRYIRDTYGTGNYRIFVKIKNKLIKGGNKLVSVEAKNTQEKGSDLKMILLAMEQNNRSLIEALRPKNDDSEEKYLEKMLKYKELFGSKESSSGLSGVRESLKFMRDLGIVVGGQKEEKEPSIIDSILQLAPLLQTAIANQNSINQNQQVAAGGQRVIEQEVIVEKKEKVKANNEVESVNNRDALNLKMGINILVSAAKKGLDQASYAEIIIGQVSVVVINEVILNDDWWETLLSLAPSVDGHKEWFLVLREHIKAQLGIESAVGHLYESDDGNEGDVLTVGDSSAINLSNDKTKGD